MRDIPVSYRLTRPQVVKWIAALRSGKYKQGSGYLCRGDRYCCIGVLAVEVLGMEEKRKPSQEEVDYVLLGAGFLTSLPKHMFPEDVQSALICMNDIHLNTFETIACYLEEKLDRFPET